MNRFLRVGKANPHDDRIVEAITTKNTTLPALSLFGKDHKVMTEEEKKTKGPKRRPVGHVSEGPGVRVSNLAAKVLNKATDLAAPKSECISKEGLLAEVEALNQKLKDEAFDDEIREERPPLIIGSLDFNEFYPSFNPDEVGEIVKKQLSNGDIKINGNDLEVSRFLTIALTDKEKKDNDLEDILHSVKDGEKLPKMTDQEMTGSDQFRVGPRSKLNPPKRKPTEKESKMMMAIAMSWIVKYIMTNFLYTFGGNSLKQESGSPIGDEISQAISRIIGKEYDEIFVRIMEELGIPLEIYKRYVDDQNLALRSIGREVMFCPRDGTLQKKNKEQIDKESSVR